jgi:hypothetical protein
MGLFIIGIENWVIEGYHINYCFWYYLQCGVDYRCNVVLCEVMCLGWVKGRILKVLLLVVFCNERKGA